VYGVQNLVHDFTATHPNNFLVLSCIIGSVVEGLCSQLKFAVSGKFSSINYSWAQRTVIVKANVHSNHSNNIYYSDEHLAIAKTIFIVAGLTNFNIVWLSSEDTSGIIHNKVFLFIITVKL
jgi:hypothetical protein